MVVRNSLEHYRSKADAAAQAEGYKDRSDRTRQKYWDNPEWVKAWKDSLPQVSFYPGQFQNIERGGGWTKWFGNKKTFLLTPYSLVWRVRLTENSRSCGVFGFSARIKKALASRLGSPVARSVKTRTAPRTSPGSPRSRKPWTLGPRNTRRGTRLIVPRRGTIQNGSRRGKIVSHR